MLLLSTLLLSAGIVTCVYSNVTPTENHAGNLCPPPEDISPCTCFNVFDRVTARCSNFTNANEIQAIFDRNPGLQLQDVWIEDCTMSFLPAKLLEDAHFETLNVTSTSLVTLFDKTPVTTPKLNLYLNNVKIMRGIHWSDIANSTLLELGAFNMTIRSLGKDFKNNVPKSVERVFIENTGITSIKDQAFSQLHKLQLLVMRKGSLKKLSRDWFPKPWDVSLLDFSYQKIASLPEDMFVDIPKLSAFFFVGNLLTTISEKVFTKHTVFYTLSGNPIDCNCHVKWIVRKIEPPYLHGECIAPKSLKGKELKSLTVDTFRHCH